MAQQLPFVVYSDNDDDEANDDDEVDKGEADDVDDDEMDETDQHHDEARAQ